MPGIQSPLTKRLGLLANLTELSLASLTDLESSPAHFERGSEIFHDGQLSDTTCFVQQGWGC